MKYTCILIGIAHIFLKQFDHRQRAKFATWMMRQGGCNVHQISFLPFTVWKHQVIQKQYTQHQKSFIYRRFSKVRIHVHLWCFLMRAQKWLWGNLHGRGWKTLGHKIKKAPQILPASYQYCVNIQWKYITCSCI